MISVIIPAYNESLNILDIIQCVKNQLVKYPEGYEIIIIDDHSSDNTFDLVASLKDPKVRAIRLSRRSGSHTALRAGYHEAKGDAVIFVSADGQDDPQLIDKMIARWKSGAAVVWGLRKNRVDEPVGIKIPAYMFYRILKWMTKWSPDQIDVSRVTFYLLDRKVVDALNACPEKNTSLFGLVAWLGFKQDYIEYDRPLRKRGASKFNTSRRINLAKDWIIAFSAVPLRMITWVGSAIAALGFLYAGFIIINYFMHEKSLQGWSSIMVVVLCLGGLNMIMLGVIGEYLYRTLSETRDRPLFFIENRTSHHNDENT